MTKSTSQSKAKAAKSPQSSSGIAAEDASKDEFFAELATIGNAMIAKHGADFAMGAFILAARFIAEGKSLSQKPESATGCGPGCSGDHHHHHHDHDRRGKT